MKRLWIAFAVVIVISFSILGWIGTRIYQEKPPIPDKVVATDGRTLIGPGEIGRGQNVWQSMGGMQVGSIWGHGSYVAPDWTADWLHREVTSVLDSWAGREYEKKYTLLGAEDRARLRGRLEQLYRTNTYDPATNTIRISPVRADAFEACVAHYSEVFLNGNKSYAIPPGTVSSPERLRQLASFFFWTAWAASAERPGDNVTYTHNWPHEPLVGNRPSGEMVMWTGVSIIMLLAGICALVWWYSAQKKEDSHGPLPPADPLGRWQATASQRATLKYFWVVAALILFQMLMGVVTAHYGVEGDGLYGIRLSNLLPYSVTRTWHVQTGIFWIATAWLAAGLFIGPLVSGHEPKGQRLGVNVLFLALLAIVAGSLTGEWLSIKNKLSDATSFLWGHQGYEYVDLGRGWQALLFVGLLIWLALVIRSVRPVLGKTGEGRPLLWLFLISAGAIGLFYGAGLTWGQHSHLSIVEYWRWWVVHLWVEGFFEVFATVAIAFLFVRLGLIRLSTATGSVLLSTIVFLSGGIIGTFHHLYFTGTPVAILALGATFSALEVVPLVLMGFEGYGNLKISRGAEWIQGYKWPIYFFLSVSFWNLVGAGIFGFLINPPIALYYMQGLNTTPVHGHTALFGVYGMLGIGLMLFVLKSMDPGKEWNQNWIRFAFWTINIGLALMVLISVLPVGLAQTWVSVRTGMWYARSADFLQDPTIAFFRWLRVVGDTVFAVGALALAWFIFGLKGGWSIKKIG